MVLRNLLFLVLLALPFSDMKAQDDPEYRMEVGGSIGIMTYQGDFNRSILSGENTAPSASLILRRVINPYSALKFSVDYGQLKGGSKNLETAYPDFNTHQYAESARKDYEFSNMLLNFGASYEYNFWPYGTGRDYRGAKRLTPYMSIGLGLTYVNTEHGTVDLADKSEIMYPGMIQGEPEFTGSKGVFTANLPVGFGVKYKLAERLNLSAEWLMHFSLSDKLDGVKDPYRVSSNGIFKNTDCFSKFQVSLTYSFWEKCKTCNKDY